MIVAASAKIAIAAARLELVDNQLTVGKPQPVTSK